MVAYACSQDERNHDDLELVEADKMRVIASSRGIQQSSRSPPATMHSTLVEMGYDPAIIDELLERKDIAFDAKMDDELIMELIQHIEALNDGHDHYKEQLTAAGISLADDSIAIQSQLLEEFNKLVSRKIGSEEGEEERKTDNTVNEGISTFQPSLNESSDSEDVRLRSFFYFLNST